ncbi:MAG: ribosome biogenesis/translation initiation ATPase RLI [Nitrososphaeraceae archaeon]
MGNPETTARVAVLDEELCKPKKCGLECIIYCPVNKTGGECIVQREEDGKAVISEDLCTGCGICVKKCPFEAIVIVNLPKELGERKIHQYGINSFRLYHLPTPKKNSVVGLLGRNGMGKSTIVNILSGNLIPNFGNYDSKPEWEYVIEKFHGTELKSHFESIANGNLRVSIKPQLVYKIPKIFKGTVNEMLKKFDENKTAKEISDELGLKNSLTKNINELSGGELQRLAVTVAAAKDADYYFFDEPSSYNDIFQRLSVAKVIQNLARNGKTVLIIEHDLTLLDYLSDYIHILYGEPGAYGIVSSLQSTKAGINNFLDGFIPSENIRFREKRFRFDTFNPIEDYILNNPVTMYSDLERKLDSFYLKVSSGKLNKGEVLGVIGANALGKTTFMKMVAGIEKSDNGKIVNTAKISYKPQYIAHEYDSDVKSLLYSAYQNIIEGSVVEEQIIIPMGVKKLYEKNIRNLSGGELQKVAIAICLMRDADIYALDEPSAFIDIEERISLAKFIQRFVRAQSKSAIIIDHDMQLIDIVADSLIIFNGNPGIEGIATKPMSKLEGMNLFLKDLSITYRRDESTGRPRVNKYDSQLDKTQKESGEYYYIKK